MVKHVKKRFLLFTYSFTNIKSIMLKHPHSHTHSVLVQLIWC